MEHNEYDFMYIHTLKLSLFKSTVTVFFWLNICVLASPTYFDKFIESLKGSWIKKHI